MKNLAKPSIMDALRRVLGIFNWKFTRNATGYSSLLNKHLIERPKGII